MIRNEVFIAIFYITLGVTGRMRDHFGPIRNETLGWVMKVVKKGRRKRGGNKGGRKGLFLLNDQYFSG